MTDEKIKQEEDVFLEAALRYLGLEPYGVISIAKLLLVDGIYGRIKIRSPEKAAKLEKLMRGQQKFVNDRINAARKLLLKQAKQSKERD